MVKVLRQPNYFCAAIQTRSPPMGRLPKCSPSKCNICLEPLPQSKYFDGWGSCENRECMYPHLRHRSRNKQRIISNLPPDHQGLEGLIDKLAIYKSSQKTYRIFENVLSANDCEQAIQWLKRLEPNYDLIDFGLKKNNDNKR
jgi:hypothetical protein